MQGMTAVSKQAIRCCSTVLVATLLMVLSWSITGNRFPVSMLRLKMKMKLSPRSSQKTKDGFVEFNPFSTQPMLG